MGPGIYRYCVNQAANTYYLPSPVGRTPLCQNEPGRNPGQLGRTRIQNLKSYQTGDRLYNVLYIAYSFP